MQKMQQIWIFKFHQTLGVVENVWIFVPYLLTYLRIVLLLLIDFKTILKIN